jgi:epoxyqueuosine reductase
LGFDLVGFTTAEPIDGVPRSYYQQWLADGCAAGMGYLHRNTDKRFNPGLLLERAKSVICVALNYKPSIQNEGRLCRIADYALYEDYHIHIKQQLHMLADFIRKTFTTDFQYKICVDSVPLAERVLAWRAGLGFIGKNHCLIHPELGGQLLLGEMITTLSLDPDEPLKGTFCGTCTKCRDACPSQAISDNFGYDCRKCISYWTIEAKGDIPQAIQDVMGYCLYGCDKCLQTCPFCVKAPVTSNNNLKIHPERASLDPQQILIWNKSDFLAHFADSPVERLGLEQLKRNAAICIRNTFQ